MNIFISSTIYDLLDVRQEVFEALRQVGFQVLLSEIPESDFLVATDRSSIETCLANVRNSDYFVIILDRRYGPSLDKVGYEKISATHLEYEEARKTKKPIFFFARDKSIGELGVWKKDKKSFSGVWVSQKDTSLFELIEKHSKLSEKSENNWFFTFRSSLDLKETLLKQLRVPLMKHKLPELISKGQIPSFSFEVSVKFMPDNITLHVACDVTNNSQVAAFMKILHWKDTKNVEPETKIPNIIMPGSGTRLSFLVSAGVNRPRQTLSLQYSDYSGVLISEEVEVYVRAVSQTPGAFIQGVKPILKEFTISTPVLIPIT